MNKEQEMVREFHRLMDLTVGDKPSLPNDKDWTLRCKLIEEETLEHATASNIVALADALGDLLYVVYGAAITYGLDMEPIFAEIHRSNMSKLWTEEERMEKLNPDLIFSYRKILTTKCYLAKNSYGKVIKSSSYSPANLKPIIEEQIKSYEQRTID